MIVSTRLASAGWRLTLMFVIMMVIGWLSRRQAGWPVAVLASTIPAVCPTYESSDTPILIPDSDPNGVHSTLVLNGPARVVTSISVRLNSLQHPFVGDLRLKLIGPNNETVTLIGDPGVYNNDGDNFYGTTLGDGFATSILNGTAPFTGGYQPVEALSRFVGDQVVGTWQLNVADVAERDTGSLESWALEVCSLPVRLWLPLILR